VVLILGGIGVLVAGVWSWNDYSYWACHRRYTFGGAMQETCMSRPQHPHRLLGATLIVGSSGWLIAWLFASRRWGRGGTLRSGVAS
jgi:hypothetical protein